MAILVDMDCILVDMLPEWIRRYNAVTGESISVSDIVGYNLSEVCKHEDVLYNILCEKDFFYSLEPMPGAVEGLNTLLEENYDVVIVTQPPRLSKHGITDKKRWVQKHFPNFGQENMIFCHRKDMVMGEILFDDKPEHLCKWEDTNPNGLTATIDWPYNKYSSVHFRGSREEGWKDFVTFVRENAAPLA